MYDVAIIGAGISGCATARYLSRYKLRVALLEAGGDVASGASRANSAIVHAGYDAKPGTLMARLNVRGNALFTQWCTELDVPLKRCGSLVLAFDDEQMRELEHLMDYGEKNGVPELSIISGEEALKMEPNLSRDVKAALLAKTAGITCPYELTIACAENAQKNGCDLIRDFRVTGIADEGEGITLTAADGRQVRAAYIVNAAGVHSDEVAALAGDHSFTITPRQGEYMLLDRAAGDIVHTVIFQTPSKMGKGILVSPTVDGNLFAGPTARDSADKEDTATTREGMDELGRMSRLSVPDVPLGRVITSFTGIRATPSTGDFIIGRSQAQARLVNCAGICSPGLTSAPAVAELVAEELAAAGLQLVPDESYDPVRKHIRRFAAMSEQERAEAIAEDPRYGHIICRCETISEAEIVEAVRRGARSVDGVKRRCRAGMGRCQGGFCMPRVMEIIARETGMPVSEVTKQGGGSYIIARSIKEGE